MGRRVPINRVPKGNQLDDRRYLQYKLDRMQVPTFDGGNKITDRA